MMHSTYSQVLHDQSVAKSTEYGIKKMNRQPDLIPESQVGEVAYDVYTSRQ